MHESLRRNAGFSRTAGGWSKSRRERFDRRAQDEGRSPDDESRSSRGSIYTSLTGEMEEFVKIIRETPEFKNFQEQKARISEKPELKAAADSLRMENYELQMTASDEEVTEEVLKFADDNEDLYRIPEVHDYLCAEASFCKMMQEVLDCLMNGIFDEFN
ncbi:Control of competence regulator ComK, YlbF/YmcA [Lachnospiraceae bacterium]|nr:Control of competence regulator ComK, YlbF/YmcA [Lachnospiraceae bacterium]